MSVVLKKFKRPASKIYKKVHWSLTKKLSFYLWTVVLLSLIMASISYWHLYKIKHSFDQITKVEKPLNKGLSGMEPAQINSISHKISQPIIHKKIDNAINHAENTLLSGTSGLIAYFIAIFVIGRALIRWVSHDIQRSFAGLHEKTDKIARGYMGHKIRKIGIVEHDRLAEDLNAMTANLRENYFSRQQIESMLSVLGSFRLNLSSDGIITDLNSSAAELLGYNPEELIGTSLNRVINSEITNKIIGQLTSTGMLQRMKCLFKKANGETIPVFLFGLILYEENNTNQVKEIVLLAQQDRRNHPSNAEISITGSTMDLSGDGIGIAITDSSWKIISVNHTFSEITGLDLKHTLGLPIPKLMPHCKLFCDSSHNPTTEYQGIRPNGQNFEVSLTVHPVNALPDHTESYLITLKDTTELKHSKQCINRLAYYDDLTGLANRSQFHNRIDESIKNAQRHNQQLGLLYMDLDGFKEINDSLGHDAGDELLRVIGTRLSDSLRENDSLARMGGDEFCILLEYIESDYSAALVAERCLHDINQPITISNRTICPRVSIGIALFPIHGENRHTLIRCADNAMYTAKAKGRHQYAFYTAEMTELAEQRLSLEHDLRDAFEKGEFELHYQPQIALNNGRMVAVEALVRWHSPTRGLVPPGEFIEVIEQMGLMNELGEWVLRTACGQLNAWRQAGVPAFRMAVNISGSHFQSETIVETVRKVLSETGVKPDSLELEVTEGVMQVTEKSLNTFQRLKGLGITVALDDFGTGYSCLGSLNHLPLDCLKVDRIFISDLIDKPEQSVLIGTIIAMGRALNLLVVAEGVETLEQAEYLHGLGCEIVQGFYFSRPVVADQIPKLAATIFFPVQKNPNQQNQPELNNYQQENIAV